MGARERLSSLPWFSEDGSRRTADVQSIAGIARPNPWRAFGLFLNYTHCLLHHRKRSGRTIEGIGG